MAGYVIVCAFDSGTEPDPTLAAALQLTEQLRLVRGEQHPELWARWSGLDEIEAVLAAALAGGKVSSAALLLGAVPAPEDRWLLSHWRGQLAVHGAIASLDPRLWTAASAHELIDIRIFTPSSRHAPVIAAGQPDDPGPGRPVWVETAAEYPASLTSTRPTLITAPVHEITARMRHWFDDLADDRVGGAITLLATSGIRRSTRSLAVLRNPAALGLRRVSGSTQLAEQCRSGAVSARALGVGSGVPGARYGVCLDLTATAGSDVRVDTGLIFEQEQLNGVQNLVIAEGRIIAAAAGRTPTAVLPAWCLNRQLAPPAGEPVRPTPLYLPLGGGADQDTVWRIAERPLNSFGGIPVSGPFSRELEDRIEDRIEDFPLDVLDIGANGLRPALAIKYVPAERAAMYHQPGQRLWISSTSGFTWGRATYVTPIAFPLSTAIFGRVGIVSRFVPDGWRTFDARVKENEDLYLSWLQSQQLYRRLLLTAQPAYISQLLRNDFRRHFRIDCVLFRPDQTHPRYTKAASDVWMAVTDWKGDDIAMEYSERFLSPRLAVVIEEEFRDEMAGIHRTGLLNLNTPWPPGNLSDQIRRVYDAGLPPLRIPS